ncbi:hypothetical protein MMC10_000306 [Thelotrema lepadinum]|nr:hypothetical protein [Thelotrema lepadinum]
MASHTTLDAAATDRKARLAKLRSLKRKQPSEEDETQAPSETAPLEPASIAEEDKPSVTSTFLSGRNYDASAAGPKLGFESQPNADQDTLEIRAREIADNTRQAAAEEEKEERPIDLFKLQPKKPNWDLKRDVAKKMEVLNVQTDNAIARLVRERIEGQKKRQKEKEGINGGAKQVEGREEGEGGEAVGMEGEELVEGIHLREKEEAEDEARELSDDEDA